MSFFRRILLPIVTLRSDLKRPLNCTKLKFEHHTTYKLLREYNYNNAVTLVASKHDQTAYVMSDLIKVIKNFSFEAIGS